jgi:muramoyltetrapeptide carboxypeptidase
MGPVSGGNLTTLCHLVGTPFEPTFSGKILLLEDCGEACYRIDRMLTQMKLAGCFKKIAGIALGSFQDCGDEKSLYGVIKQIFQADEIPIMTGFEMGHGDHNITLPLGLDAVLDTTSGSLCFKQPATVG